MKKEGKTIKVRVKPYEQTPSATALGSASENSSNGSSGSSGHSVA